MPKNDAVYVGHMLDLARAAVGKVQGTSRAVFDADENLRLAVTHLTSTTIHLTAVSSFEIIGRVKKPTETVAGCDHVPAV